MAVGDNRTINPKRHTTVRFSLPIDTSTPSAAVLRDGRGIPYRRSSQSTEPKHNDQQSHSLSQGPAHQKLTPAMDGDSKVTNQQMNSIEAVVSPDGNKTPPIQPPKSSLETQNGMMDKSGSAEMLDDAGSRNSGKDRHSSGTSNDSRGKPSAADTAKAKEREERLRQAKEKAAQDHMKKLEELREAQKKAREFRKKQEEERRKKLEEMRRKEESHRNLVEERRKRLEMEDYNRRQAILRRSAEREAKLEQMRSSSRRSTAGSITVDARTRSSIDLHSARDLSMSSKSEAKCPASSRGMSTSMTHLAMQKSPSKNTGKQAFPDKSVSASVTNLDSATPPMKRPKSSQSDLAMSASSDGSPIRRPRPHSVAGRLPSYASPTVSSQIRMSRDSEKKSSGNLTVCYRFRSVSPGPKRSKSADTRRSRADIQRTFERLAMPRVVPTKDTQKDVMVMSSSSVQNTQRPGVPRSLPKDIKINTAAAARGVLPNKATSGPAKDTISTKVAANAAAAAHKDKVAPAKDKPAPPKEKTLPQREKATPPRDRAPIRERPATRERAPDHNKVINAEKPAPREKSASAKDRVPAHKVQKDKSNAQKEKVITKQPQPTKALNKEKVSKAGAAAKEKVAPKEKVSHKEVKKEKPAEVKAKKPSEPKPEKPAAEEVIKAATAAPASSGLPVTDIPKKVEEEPSKKPLVEKENDKKGKEPSASPAKESPKEKTPTKEMAPSMPGAAPAQPSKPMTKEEEYKAKLAENRRLAREKAEREAEEERKRQEEIRRQEEERRRREEEEERRQMEEAMRLAEEARKAEEERLRKAVEAEEKRKKEEAERLEAERKAKEEAERKAQEEAERKERERAEKAKKEEEERLERKKRLEMIMKRTRKNDDGKLESPGSPSKSVVTPPKQATPTESPPQQVSPMEESISAPGSTSPPHEVTSPGETTDSVRPQKLPLSSVTRDDAPKFKSPLLQQILGGRTRAKPADKNGEENQQEEGKENAASSEKKPSEDTVSLTNIEVEVPREDNANMAEKARNFIESVVSKVTESMQGKQHDADKPESVESAAAPSSEQTAESAKEPTPELTVEKSLETVNKEDNESVPVSEPVIELSSESVIESEKQPSVQSVGLKPAEETPADSQDTESAHKLDNVEITQDVAVSDHLDALATGSEPSSEPSEGVATPTKPGSEQIEEGAEPSSPDKKSVTDVDHLVATDEDKDIDTSCEATDLLNNVSYSVTTMTTTITRTEREVIQDDSNRLVNGYTVKDTELSQTDSLLAETHVNGTGGEDTTHNVDQPLADYSTLDNKNLCQVTATGDTSQLINFEADFINSNAPESQLQADNKTLAKDSTPDLLL